VSAEGQALAERLGNHGTLSHCRRAIAMVDWAETGDLRTLEAFGHRDRRLCRDAGLPWESWSCSWLALASFLRGDWDTAVLHAEQGDTLSPPGVIHGTVWALHFEYRAAAGPKDQALAMLADHGADLPRLGQPNGWGSWAMLLSAIEGLVVLGEWDAAAELYPLVRWCSDRTGTVGLMQPDLRLLERAAGMAAAAGSDWDAAAAHFTTALRQAETLPHRPEQAHTRRVYGGMLLRRGRPGDRETAARLLGQAEALYRDMGIARHRALTGAMGR
jgi:hypothetical protein